MILHRGFCHDADALHLKVVALCAVFMLTAFGPCTMTRTQNLSDNEEYGSYTNDLVRVHTSGPNLNLENICRRSDLFCFPSTLSGFFSVSDNTEANVSGLSGVKADTTGLVGEMQPMDDDDLWSSNRANFQLLNGNIVSCQLESKESGRDSDDEKDTSVRIKFNHVNDFSSQNVEISHPLLDWGQKYLHFPSLAYLTVENRHKTSVLNVFEPYSTNTQFYPCNYTEIKINPGEVASLCFVFVPKWLGLSSAHLILQTSSGGFLVRAQGFAVQPPYKLQSSHGSTTSTWVVSLSNPSKEVLHLKEVSAWISFSSGNVSYLANGVCSMIDHTGSSEISVNEWLDVKIGQLSQPVMAIRPLKTWHVGAYRNEPILEVEFPYQSRINVFGSFCVQLLNNASKDDLDTIIFEAEFGGKSGTCDLETRVSISLNALMPCDGNGTTGGSLVVENDGPDLLTVVKISAVGENTESLQTKYVEGLLLFPYSVTQVAMVTYTPNLHTNLNCRLVVQTNKSNAPELEIPCSEIARLCLQSHSYERYGVLNDNNAESRSSKVHVHPPLELKGTESDESVLGNWRSQGTESGMSILDDHEVTFPVVLIGTHHSKWIKVINPSDQPVAMQLLLNSGEIINECRESDDFFQTSSSYNLVLNSHTAPSRHGFSIPHNALTEAYVHPHGKTVLGPIVFHPSGRCAWKSSALVRNNLSGVEWLSLRGSGGFASLILHDGEDPVHTIELKHNYNYNYSQPFMKVLFVQNTGDLPLKVNKITVSGTKCELDGFVVGKCKGFTLQPGESEKIIITYRSEICAETVLRDLELGMVGGILVVPIKVSRPKLTVTICKRSLFWMRFKFFFVGLVSVLVVIMATAFMSGTHSSDVCLKSDNSNKVVASSTLKLKSMAVESPKHANKVAASSPSSNLELKSMAVESHKHENKVVAPLLPSSTLKLKSVAVESPKPANKPMPSSPSSTLELSMVVESPKPEKLTVKTGKDKARRRNKKRGSGAGLTGCFDGQSSHSSNSAPSSPLSPAVKCYSPKTSPEFSPNQSVRVRSPFNHGGSNTVSPVKEKPSTPPKPTAQFERAPGAKGEAVKPEESDARLEYNIWDYHLQLRDSGLFEVGSDMPIMAKDDNFGSFFETSPQELFKADTVSFKQND